MARLILDTGVLVAGARGILDPAQLPDVDDVALPAVVVAEYLAGVLLDDDAGRRAAQRAFLEDVLAVTPVEDYDSTVANTAPNCLPTYGKPAVSGDRTTSSSRPRRGQPAASW